MAGVYSGHCRGISPGASPPRFPLCLTICAHAVRLKRGIQCRAAAGEHAINFINSTHAVRLPRLAIAPQRTDERMHSLTVSATVGGAEDADRLHGRVDVVLSQLGQLDGDHIDRAEHCAQLAVSCRIPVSCYVRNMYDTCHAA